VGLIWANGALENQWLAGYGLRQVKREGVTMHGCMQKQMPLYLCCNTISPLRLLNDLLFFFFASADDIVVPGLVPGLGLG
jgi:hypothetical protein